MNLNPKTYEAYQLLHEGTLALARAEQQGIRVDLTYAEKKKLHLTKKIERLEQQFQQTNFFKHWQHTVKGKVNINSNPQLSHFLYITKKLDPIHLTVTGQGSTDEDALVQLNIPELNTLLEIRKLKKIRDTYLDGFTREAVNGVIHPSFNLHLVRTYRSCIAKGTLILAVRDFIKYPKGVPIEEIQIGDYVYCFDNDLRPVIRKVLWAGKTSHKEVIRIHYTERGGGGQGYLDVTPEHKIRLIDGSYERASNLTGDFRKLTESHHLPKIRTLSCKRVGDTLRFTGHLKGGNGVLEHRLIYEQLVGKLSEKEVVHHKNRNHLDHVLSNLKKMILPDHSSFHSRNASKEIKQKRINTLNKNRYKIKYKKGEDHPNYLNLSKFTCYRLLAEAAGQIVKVHYDFGTFKKYLTLHNINPWNVRLRFDKHGKYIWKVYLQKLSVTGRANIEGILGHNHYKLLKLYDEYGLNKERKWANQFGEFKPGNHIIKKIEWIHKTVDVYDIEVEDFNNFFANELCVHNSSDKPNLQNIPIRDEESMQACRRALYPREGHQLLEVDFKGIEVAVVACYHKDPNMLKYINDPSSDMHRDMAEQIFKIKYNGSPEHKTLRAAAKNGFVFPEFYGDYYKNCAVGMACNWGKLPQNVWKPGQGILVDETTTLSDHLRSQGIKSFNSFTQHIKEVEDDFWSNRFPDYREWKERWWKTYQKYGYISLLTGFTCSGVMSRNDCINYPVQGSAFHCLLWSLIEIDRIMRKENWDTKIIGQIHDSILFDLCPDEWEHVVEVVKQVTCEDLPQAWKWIIVPLDVDVEVSPVDGSWAEKEKLVIK